MNLSHNNIGFDGAVALAGEMKCLTELDWLDLSHNNIGPDGTTALAGDMKCLTKLEWLDLSHNNIGPGGAAALAEGAKCGARPHDGNKDSAGSTETHGDRPGTRSGNKWL